MIHSHVGTDTSNSSSRSSGKTAGQQVPILLSPSPIAEASPGTNLPGAALVQEQNGRDKTAQETYAKILMKNPKNCVEGGHLHAEIVLSPEVTLAKAPCVSEVERVLTPEGVGAGLIHVFPWQMTKKYEGVVSTGIDEPRASGKVCTLDQTLIVAGDDLRGSVITRYDSSAPETCEFSRECAGEGTLRRVHQEQKHPEQPIERFTW